MRGPFVATRRVVMVAAAGLAAALLGSVAAFGQAPPPPPIPAGGGAGGAGRPPPPPGGRPAAGPPPGGIVPPPAPPGGAPGGPRPGQPPGPPGPPPGGGPGVLAGTIAAIGGEYMVLTLPDGRAQPVALAPATTYARAGRPIGADAPRVGDRVRAQVRAAEPGALVAQAVAIELPWVEGRVAEVAGDAIVLATRERRTRVVVAPDAIVRRFGLRAAASDLAVGDTLRAEGTISADGATVSALALDAWRDRRGGRLTRLDGGTLEIAGPPERPGGPGAPGPGRPAGGATTVALGAATIVLRGRRRADAGALAVGRHVDVEGTIEADGRLAAAVVRVAEHRLHGEIAVVEPGRLVLLDNGFARVVAIGPATAFAAGGAAATAADARAGAWAEASGSLDPDGTLAAWTVALH